MASVTGRWGDDFLDSNTGKCGNLRDVSEKIFVECKPDNYQKLNNISPTFIYNSSFFQKLTAEPISGFFTV